MFTIVIEETNEIEKPYEVEYKRLHDGADTEDHPSHGYVRAPGTHLVEVTRKVLSQQVPTLDLKAVIIAINKIGEPLDVGPGRVVLAADQRGCLEVAAARPVQTLRAIADELGRRDKVQPEHEYKEAAELIEAAIVHLQELAKKF